MKHALIDIGNTSIKTKLFDKATCISSLQLEKTSSSLSHFFSLPLDLFFISSVVPSINKKIKKINQTSTYFINHSDFSDLTIQIDKPKTVGIDRLVNALAIFHKWKEDTLIIDIGTATTFCLVTKKGQYKGGVLMPGFNMLKNTLYENAEQLPLVQFPNSAPPIIGKSTKTAIESGLFHGAIYMINGMQQNIKKEENVKLTILTGNIPNKFLPHINHDVFSRDLQFEGLRILYQQYQEKQ